MGKPEIRFKGYTDEWEQRKLGDIYGSIGNAFVGTATPYYAEQGHFYLESNNVKDGQINHNSEIFINDEFYEKQKDKWLHTGDMVMVQSGHVGHAAVIPEELDNTAAHALIMFRNPKEEIEPYFLNYEYQTDKAKKKIDNITTGNTIKHILASDMQEFVVDVPKYEEQKVIAGYFYNIDHLITLHQRKCDEVKSLKKYMLQKMFPQNEQKVPEIRFKGFTEAWEQRKLGEVTQCLDSERVPINSEEREKIPGEIPYYGAGNIQGYINKFLFDEELVLLLEDGDAFDDFRMKEIAQYICGKTWVNNHAHVLRPLGDAYFLYVTLSHKDIRNWVQLAGASRKKLVQKSMLNIELFMPHIIEQKKIGQYFSNLDHLITLHQQKCEELKKIKKFMLQKMFV